ncbi:MAG TPA: recombinase family protein, partial [Hyphomicrobium sp.]|nr:recombinase family protein [Hyphomicrobium sp.]
MALARAAKRLKRGDSDDAGYSGGTMERPALKRLLADIAAHRIDAVVVYKVDRLTVMQNLGFRYNISYYGAKTCTSYCILPSKFRLLGQAQFAFLDVVAER